MMSSTVSVLAQSTNLVLTEDDEMDNILQVDTINSDNDEVISTTNQVELFNEGNRFLRWRINNSLVFNIQDQNPASGQKVLLSNNNPDTLAMKWRYENGQIIGANNYCLSSTDDFEVVLANCSSDETEWEFDEFGRLVGLVVIDNELTYGCAQGNIIDQDIEVILTECHQDVTQLFELEGTGVTNSFSEIIAAADQVDQERDTVEDDSSENEDDDSESQDDEQDEDELEEETEDEENDSENGDGDNDGDEEVDTDNEQEEDEDEQDDSEESDDEIDEGDDDSDQGEDNSNTILSVSETLVNENDLNFLIGGVIQAGLADDVANSSNITIFAPTDQAFENLPTALLLQLLDPVNVEMLQTVLQYHIVPESLDSGDVLSREALTTLEGRDITVQSEALTLNDITGFEFLELDIEAEGDVFIHKINTVLIPEGFLDLDPEIDAMPGTQNPVTVDPVIVDDEEVEEVIDEVVEEIIEDVTEDVINETEESDEEETEDEVNQEIEEVEEELEEIIAEIEEEVIEDIDSEDESDEPAGITLIEDNSTTDQSEDTEEETLEEEEEEEVLEETQDEVNEEEIEETEEVLESEEEANDDDTDLDDLGDSEAENDTTDDEEALESINNSNNALEVAGTVGLSTFVSAIEAAELDEDIIVIQDATILAPSDDAFAALGSEVLEILTAPENQELLEDILKYHIVDGELSLDELLEMDTLTTLESNEITVQPEILALNNIAGFNFDSQDIGADEVTIHIINTVLLNTDLAQRISELLPTGGGGEYIELMHAKNLLESGVIIDPETEYKLQIYFPVNKSRVNGLHTLQGEVEGLDVNDYEMYWSVDNGQLNLMPSLFTKKHAFIDFSSWNWNEDKNYEITYSAFQDGELISEEKENIIIP